MLNNEAAMRRPKASTSYQTALISSSMGNFSFGAGWRVVRIREGHNRIRRPRRRRILFSAFTTCALMCRSSALQVGQVPKVTRYMSMCKKESSSHLFSIRPDVTPTNVLADVEPVLSEANHLVDKAATDESVNEDEGSALETHDWSKHHRICRVVASPDGKLPTSKSSLPPSLFQAPPILEKLDAIYHAISHEETRRLSYLERYQASTKHSYDETEEEALIAVLRNSLEDAGFELLTQRDIDLCQALNAGYLLRLSIEPDVASCDASIAKQFYPERFSNSAKDGFLFDGRVLLYRRGYSSQVTEGRLILPKLDYLQANLVQRSTRSVSETLGAIEIQLASIMAAIARQNRIFLQNLFADVADAVPSESVANFLRQKWGWEKTDSESLANTTDDMAKTGFFRLARYGGSKNRCVDAPGSDDALDPFLSCEIEEDDDDPALNAEYFGKVNGDLKGENVNCRYDAERNRRPGTSSSPTGVLLERVSLTNLVDLSTSQGRRTVVKRFFSKSQLVEPTYEEVFAIWRPLPEKPKPKNKFFPPKFVYDVAEIFAIEDKLPELDGPEPEPVPPPLELRTFDGVPMANAAAVLPKTKLLFRPADAFVFDFITVASLIAVFGSVRFDNPRLDVLALVSGTVWLIRTIIRYSNKLARYDLLVKTFLTSKISHRNSGALKYITRAAGTQRATRAALVHLWLVKYRRRTKGTITKKSLVEQGPAGVNALLRSSQTVRVDIEAALNDLVDLDLIGFRPVLTVGEALDFVKDEDETIMETLKETWDHVFVGDLSLNRLVGKRSR